MRKLLLGTTALAAAATITANTALADVTISGSYEFKYLSRSSNTAALDGTTMTHGDTDMVVNFTSKTDSGLDLTFRYDIGAVGSTDGGGLTIDEASLSESLKNKNIKILVDLAEGDNEFTSWTSDLTEEYIKINADYRS